MALMPPMPPHLRLPRNDGDPDAPGMWWRPVRTAEGAQTAWVKAPCGHEFSLTKHGIRPDGVVSPSVVCPEKGCAFHDYLSLLGWPAEAKP